MALTATAALTATGPTFAWVAAGLVLRRLGWLSEIWAARLARAVFLAGMPVVLGFGAAAVDYGAVGHATYLFAGATATLLVTSLALGWGVWRGMAAAERAVFVQGAFRSNLGIIGIALCVDIHGGAGLALAALPVALWTILYNLIAVPLLLGPGGSPLRALLGILRNPLIIGIAVGVLVSVTGVAPGDELRTVGKLMSAAVLPLALLSIGASLDLKRLRSAGALTLETSAWRLLVAPVISLSLALAMGVRGMELEVLYLLLATPVAAASFVMVVAAGGPGALAANIVVVSTLLSALTLPLGLALLRFLV